MGTLLLLGIICLVDLCQGSSNVFVLKGEDVRLAVQKPVLEEDSFFIWRFNSEYNLVRFSNKDGEVTLNKNYRERVEFSTEDFSLRLKNLQEADSGVYTAVVSGQRDVKVAEYSVTVLERVSPVVLEVHHVSSSSDSCNITVSCSSQDSSINSTVRCDNHTCSQEGGERSEVTTLYVYLSNDSIICNHSNQVSWSKNMEEIKPLCLAPSNTGKTPLNLWWISLIVLVLLCLACGVCYFLYRRQRGKYDRETQENTVYATPEIPCRGHAVEQSPSADTSHPSPSSTYSLVGVHTAPKDPNEVEGSVYAQVQKPAPKMN